MQQLTFIKPGQLAFWEVPEPRLRGPSEALVRPFVAARCDGDAVFLRFGLSRLIETGARLHVLDPMFAGPHGALFKGPFAYGHECVAEVVRVGEDVRDFRAGDVVIVPWAAACGACGRCGRGLGAHCERASTPLPAYGFGKGLGEYGGMVSDLVRVPYADAMLVRVPEGVDPLAVASASDNLPDAYRSVAPQLAAAPGAPVLIIGGAARSIGLYAVGMAVALGASRVDYVDSDPGRLRIAEKLGARAIDLRPSARWFRREKPLLAEGYPISVEASGTVSGLRYALNWLAPGGHCTALAFYMRRGTPIPLWNMYLKSCHLHVGVSHPRQNIPKVLDLIARGAFDPLQVEPLIGNFSDGPQLLLEDTTKVILSRPRSVRAAAG